MIVKSLKQCMVGDTWQEIGQYSSAVRRFYAGIFIIDLKEKHRQLAFFNANGDFGER
jgi:hypothetical protein